MRGKIFYGAMGGGSASSGSIFLQPSGGGPISGTLQQIADNAGNATTLGLSSTSASIGRLGAAGSLVFLNDLTGVSNAGLGLIAGTANFRISGNNIELIDNANGIIISNGTTVTQNGMLTVKGNGNSIACFRSSGNVERLRIFESGSLFLNSNAVLSGISTGRVQFTAPNGTDFESIIFGQSSINGLSITKNALSFEFKNGINSLFVPIKSLTLQTEKLSGGTLADSFPFRVGNIGAITDAAFLALGLNRQIAIENNGVICYIPFSTSLIP